MGLTLVTAPTVELLSPEEAIAHVRQEQNTEDKEYIEALAITAREVLERELRRGFTTQTWRLTLDRFPCERSLVGRYGWLQQPIRLPRHPVQSVTSVKYIDQAGQLLTWPVDQYTVSIADVETRIVPAYGVAWPATRDVLDAVQVEFVAGYGDDAKAVPRALKQGLMLLVGTWYENRETMVTGTIATRLPDNVDRVVGTYRVKEFA